MWRRRSGEQLASALGPEIADSSWRVLASRSERQNRDDRLIESERPRDA
jgi:hypothetical protein